MASNTFDGIKIGSKIYRNRDTRFDPVAATSAMTQDVGLTSDGKLKAAQGGGGSVPPEVTSAIATHGIGWTEGSGATITWDGDTTGRDVVDNGHGAVWYKVSDSIISYNDFVSMSFHDFNGNILEIRKTDITSVLVEEDGIFFATYVLSGIAGNYDITTPVGGDHVFTITSAGTYFFADPDEGDYVTSLVYGNETVHQIDPKYLQDAVGDIDAALDAILELIGGA